MTITVNGKEIARVITNRVLTLKEAMYAAGWDIDDQADCKCGYDDSVDGFYIDDNGMYCFDIDAAKMVL